MLRSFIVETVAMPPRRFGIISRFVFPMKLALSSAMIATILACDDRFCLDNFAPVCGSDGQTYSNKCNFDKAQCVDPTLQLVLNDTECPSPLPLCFRACVEILDPVCGSDGHTYANNCSLANAACLASGQNLTWVSNGSCCDPCDVACTKEINPVCGSDRLTYLNPCLFEQAKCRSPALSLSSRGACPTSCEKKCPLIYSPVCGSDRVTYSSSCALYNIACSKPGLTQVATGACPCERVCTQIYAPVCGSDRRTYSNACLLQNAACKSSRLRIAYNGPCS